MSRIKSIELREGERQALEHEYRIGKTHSYRLRCKGILLKSERRTSAEVAKQLGCHEVTVNSWLRRYERGGLAGLRNLSGRGRKPILNEDDLAKVKEVVAEHRQKLSVAREELEQALGKSFSHDTLKRFVKKTLVATKGSSWAKRHLPGLPAESVPSRSRVRNFTPSKSKN